MKRIAMFIGTLMMVSATAYASQHGGPMSMQDRLQNMDRTMGQARGTDKREKRMEYLQQHMEQMRETMGQMNEMMGGRQQMMQQMGGGPMGQGGAAGTPGGGMMGGGAMGQGGPAGTPGGMMGGGGPVGTGAGMTPEMMQQRVEQMQQRMDMMQMMMDQMLEHQQQYEQMPRR
jgi:TolA-binding protein